MHRSCRDLPIGVHRYQGSFGWSERACVFVPGVGAAEGRVRLFSAHSEAFCVCQIGNIDGDSEFRDVECADLVEIYLSIFTGTKGVSKLEFWGSERACVFVLGVDAAEGWVPPRGRCRRRVGAFVFGAFRSLLCVPNRR